MNDAGGKARVLCELGIGTNPAAGLSSNVLKAEKYMEGVMSQLVTITHMGG